MYLYFSIIRMDINACKDRHAVKRHEQFVIRCGTILNKILLLSLCACMCMCHVDVTGVKVNNAFKGMQHRGFIIFD